MKSERLGLVREARSLVAKKLFDCADTDQGCGGIDGIGMRLGNHLISQRLEISPVKSHLKQPGET